jgi:hypothetical protein
LFIERYDLLELGAMAGRVHRLSLSGVGSFDWDMWMMNTPQTIASLPDFLFSEEKRA